MSYSTRIPPADRAWPSGNGPLHEHTDDVGRAAELSALSLRFGVDASARNDAGQMRAERLDALGLDELAELIETASRCGSIPTMAVKRRNLCYGAYGKRGSIPWWAWQ